MGSLNRRVQQRVTPSKWRWPRGQSGQSLVETIGSIGILGIVMSATMAMLVRQQKEAQGVRETLASLDLEKTVMNALFDGSVCEYVLNNPTVLPFNAARLPAIISLPNNRPLYLKIDPGPPVIRGPVVAQVGRPASALSSLPTIKSIQLRVTSGSNGKYLGSWQINFNTAGLVKPLKPVSVATTLTVNDSILTAAVVQRCNSNSGALSPCVYGKNKSGTLSVVSTAGFQPSDASEVFFARPLSGGSWGMGCQSGWRLMGCGGTTAGGYAVPATFGLYNGLPICGTSGYWGDEITAACCKM